jgi:hypothetical protein
MHYMILDLLHLQNKQGESDNEDEDREDGEHDGDPRTLRSEVAPAVLESDNDDKGDSDADEAKLWKVMIFRILIDISRN